MDKKNNEGKTFFDIFSNINDKDENKSISFNTIKNESDSLDDDLKMGDLFKKASDSVSNDDKFDSIDNESTFNSIFMNNDNKEDSNKVEDDSLVEGPSSIDSYSVKKMDSIFDKASIKVNENDDKNISNEEVYNNIDTPISNDSEEEVENSVSENISSNEIDNSNTLDDDTNEDIFSGMSNPFLNSGSSNNDIDEGSIDDIKEDSDLVTDDKSLMDKGNIFFDSNNDSGRVDKNITFDDNSQDNEDKVVNSNLFFSDREDDESSVGASDNVFLNDEVKDGNNDIDNDIGSSSPFFEEDEEDNDKNEEINPFFNSKINLIEESKYDDKNISNKIDTSGVQNFNVKVVKKKEPLIKFILGVLSYAVFIWLLLIGITLLVYVLDIKIRAAKGDTSPPKYNAYVVLTGSMLPEIQVYDVVITKKVDAKSLKENDVITFASSDTRFLGTIITHRIVKKNYDAKTGGYTFQTKGDNNNIADSALVQPNNIYGKVILKIPKLGYLQEFLASDGGWILVILFPCLIVISYDIVKLSKGIRKKKYKNIKVQSR